MSTHGEVEKSIEMIGVYTHDTVKKVSDSIAAFDGLADAIDDIDNALESIVDALNNLNERVQAIENKIGGQG